MLRTLLLLAVALVLAAAPVQASEIKGQYLEARNCDVWTGPCFANADYNLSGKNAVMAWRVEQGELNHVKLDGLGVVAVVIATDTLGLKQTGPARSILIVDSKATAVQREALIRLAKQQGGALLANVTGVQTAEVKLNLCPCKSNSCAELTAGGAVIKTRCLDANHDKVCGNESAFHPPLARGVDARAAATVEQAFTGPGLSMTWRDFDKRGSYVGTFSAR